MTGKSIQAFGRYFCNIVIGSDIGKLEVSPLGESLGADGGSKKGYSIGRSYSNVYGKLEIYPLG